jgi:membrane protease YdiL (CAAX protease family)
MRPRAVFFGQSILLILLVTLGKHAFAIFCKGLASGSHGTLVLTVVYYAVVTVLALSIVAIGSLLTRPSSALCHLLGFSWEKFSIPWFLVIAGLWVLPNVANPILFGGRWRVPGLGSALFVGLILAPVLEELIFRGWLQGSLHGLIGVGDGSCRRIMLVILIQSLAFSLSHFDVLQPSTIQPIAFGLHFLGGASLGLLAYRTASIWPGVVAHLLGNLVAAMNG